MATQSSRAPDFRPDHRPLRSVLYMPASNRRAIDKARGLDCDAVVLDLEDAVAPDLKAEARTALCEEVAAGGFGYRRMIARINGLSTPWGKDDLAALAVAPIGALLAPKVDSAEDVIALSEAMDAAGYGPHVALWVMIETPRAILALERIAECAGSTRLAAFVLGLNDLAKDTGMAQQPGRAAFVPVLSHAVMAARAHGLAILDGVCNAIDDPVRLEGECCQARDFGFDGKTLIHPSQLDLANRVFAPSESDVAEARAIVDAFADPANAGKGALRVNGKMAELLHRDMAKRLIEKAESISAR
ncbi:CoA ester lyase [Novosphingobium sp. KCTC 2891]|uniref:HpcH/HpaI aldolase/citrate lyase family protein n=1 Tax=Novosphingobium sp. KCTC 2891 TaxID=2989730 RepID=UPI002221DD84|nr:CoA ester lyase [Novosphingobium sp. KCTC 2891]MCW1382111.1 CoA ester lyase [Novosphingobium sp. KCTC 2891]